MENIIPISGITPEAGGVLLPEEQGEILVNGILREYGALQLAGDARSTRARRTTFPIWLGKPTAAPVGEGQRKPVTGARFGVAELEIKKFASIVVFTDEQIEDAARGHMNVLVDSDVRQPLAGVVDAHIVGKREGVNIDSVFTNSWRQTTADPIPVDLEAPDGLQTAVSAAMGVLELNGYGNPANMGVLLGFGFQQLLRDAKEDDQTTGASQRRLYGGGDPLYGLTRSVSTNLNKTVDAPTEDNIVGFVFHRPNVHVRIRTDVRVKVDQSASIELPNGETVHLFQDNMTAIRYELRMGVMTHDLDRAVVPLVNRSS